MNRLCIKLVIEKSLQYDARSDKCVIEISLQYDTWSEKQQIVFKFQEFSWVFVRYTSPWKILMITTQFSGS